VNNPLDVKENDEHALNFARLFLSQGVWIFCVRLMLSSLECLSNQCQGLRCTFSEICTKFDAIPLSNPSRNRIRPNMRLQIKRRKQSHIHPAA
jgi:hypothetical protein